MVSSPEAELERAAPSKAQLVIPVAALLLDVGVSLSGAGSQTIWYVVRAAGVVAYVLLVASVIEGLLITSKMVPAGRSRADLFEIHSFTALLALAFASFHALGLLLDTYVSFSPTQILIPLSSSYRPVAVALGILTLYLGAVIYASFWLRHVIGYRNWRRLHFMSFVAFVLVSLHGTLSGADTGTTWMLVIYTGSMVTVAGLTALRLLSSR